jgi:hypothetical protein
VGEQENARVMALGFRFLRRTPKPPGRLAHVAMRFERSRGLESQYDVFRIAGGW